MRTRTAQIADWHCCFLGPTRAEETAEAARRFAAGAEEAAAAEEDYANVNANVHLRRHRLLTVNERQIRSCSGEERLSHVKLTALEIGPKIGCQDGPTGLAWCEQRLPRRSSTAPAATSSSKLRASPRTTRRRRLVKYTLVWIRLAIVANPALPPPPPPPPPPQTADTVGTDLWRLIEQLTSS